MLASPVLGDAVRVVFEGRMARLPGEYALRLLHDAVFIE
jgi:hypothetical protein